ncbi:MAG TPA: rhodanese-like domain-containing protein [Candidatus Nanopelagicales bacterium]|nr:rhodanese-like domain-containing protein [Candidatus Nanopelagicales bacterium]
MLHRTRLTLVALLAAASILGAAGCSGGSPAGGSAPTPNTVGTGSSGASWTAPQNGTEVDVPTFASALTQPGVTVLDVRTPEEFAAGHLKDAQNLDVNSPAFAATLKTLPKDAVYAVYCRTGHRSGTAVAQMVDLGFTRVFHLAGGVTAWQASGQPVVQP